MVEKYTKSELIRLKKELEALTNSEHLLEERKKELYRLFRGMLKELETQATKYNAELLKVRDKVFGIISDHNYLEIADDSAIQPQALCTISNEVYLKEVFTAGVSIQFPDLKGQFVPEALKMVFKDELKSLLDLGIELDTLVKKTSIVKEEMKNVSRKFGYIQNILIPRANENIKIIEHMFEERRREEMIKIKKFKGKKEQ